MGKYVCGKCGYIDVVRKKCGDYMWLRNVLNYVGNVDTINVGNNDVECGDYMWETMCDHSELKW